MSSVDRRAGSHVVGRLHSTIPGIIVFTNRWFISLSCRCDRTALSSILSDRLQTNVSYIFVTDFAFPPFPAHFQYFSIASHLEYQKFSCIGCFQNQRPRFSCTWQI